MVITASSDVAKIALLRASLRRTASAMRSVSMNSPIKVAIASVNAIRSASGSRTWRAKSSITATHSLPMRTGKAEPPRSPSRMADWARG